ncbi:MAG: bifunctional oligoribonuclease/PAP phosphatase NrnA, partial [bacterium]
MCDSQSRIEEFKKAFQGFKGKKILIALRGAPDPDCISAALAHKYILESLGIESLILYNKEISHQENLALIKLLGIDLTFYKEEFSFDEFAGVSLVDSQYIDKFIASKIERLPIVSLVDHHEIISPPTAKFTDIRKDVGSTATIYAEYLQLLDLLEDDPDNTGSINLATALMHGIRTDTNSFFMARENDFLSLVYL